METEYGKLYKKSDYLSHINFSFFFHFKENNNASSLTYSSHLLDLEFWKYNHCSLTFKYLML